MRQMEKKLERRKSNQKAKYVERKKLERNKEIRMKKKQTSWKERITGI